MAEDDEQKEMIQRIFELLANNIAANTSNNRQRIIYGRTLLGMPKIDSIKQLLVQQTEFINGLTTDTEIIEWLWSLFRSHLKIFSKLINPENTFLLLSGLMGNHMRGCFKT